MVGVYDKQLLCWYLITLKLKERLDAGLPNTSEPPQQQQRPQLQQSSSPPQVVVSVGIQKPLMGFPLPRKDDWLISINKKLKDARQYDATRAGSKINIYRVPRCLRDTKREKAYIPQVVSLGPYHHGKMLLQPMELHKGRALQHILKRNNQSLKLYIDSMKEIEDRARACYEGPLKLSSNEFAEMMVLDGCFVLELFHGATTLNGFEELGYAWNDPVFSIQAGVILNSIERDMKKLENQIPLFVLGKLLGLRGEQRGQLEDEVAQLAITFFDPLMPAEETSTKIDITKLKSSTGDSTTFDPLSLNLSLHCLDVFRKSLLYKEPDHVPRKQSRDNHEADERRQQLIHCATHLKDAGIKFRKHKTDRLWDIQFNNRVLYIPPIRIDDSTESLLRNLIAFEQCHFECKQDITCYVSFLDDLINSAEDVSYLRDNKIIEHLLGSDREVADLVNSLCQEVVFDFNDSYSKLYQKINDHYDRKWNTWRAILKQKYFNNPWSILSLVAAVMLLLLTAAQTFYTVCDYYK